MLSVPVAGGGGTAEGGGGMGNEGGEGGVGKVDDTASSSLPWSLLNSLRVLLTIFEE